MEADNRPQPKLSIGITSIVVIFSALCLTIFAVLALSTAGSEMTLARKLADSVTAHYAADSSCTAAANAMGGLWESGADAEELHGLADELGGELREDGGAYYFSYSAQIDASRRLETEIRLDDDFTVMRWQTVSEDNWSPDESLPVWTGEFQEDAG